MKYPSALVVLSGGQDSTTCLFWALQQFEKVHAITFDYAQRHRMEVAAAAKIAHLAKVDHEVVLLGPILKGRSPLTDPNAPLETYPNYAEMDKTIGNRVELTFVPMRNALFLTLAANRAVAMDVWDLVTGVCQQDNANYPDCRAPFIFIQEQCINQALGTVGRFRIHTPLMDLSKADSIKLAMTIPGAYEALAYSHTAYDGSYPPTSKDHASTLRAQGFLEAGVPDPLVVRAYKEGLMKLPETENYKQVA